MQTETRLEPTDPPTKHTTTGTLPPNGSGGDDDRGGCCGCISILVLIGIGFTIGYFFFRG